MNIYCFIVNALALCIFILYTQIFPELTFLTIKQNNSLSFTPVHMISSPFDFFSPSNAEITVYTTCTVSFPRLKVGFITMIMWG